MEQSSTNLQMIGNVYGLASLPLTGIDEIKFSIGLAPGASAVDLTKMRIVFSTPETSPLILEPGDSATTTTFTAKEAGAGSSLSSMTLPADRN